jgi:hypothetical protein
MYVQHCEIFLLSNIREVGKNPYETIAIAALATTRAGKSVLYICMESKLTKSTGFGISMSYESP